MGNAAPSSRQLDYTIMNLRMVARGLEQEAKLCEVRERKNTASIREVLRPRQHERESVQRRLEKARIFAANAIREKNQEVVFLRLASRVDGVRALMEQARSRQQVTPALVRVTRGLDKTLTTLDASKITHVLDKLEAQFHDLDVRSAAMATALDSANSLLSPEEQVDTLIGQVAEEHDLSVEELFESIGTMGTAAPGGGVRKDGDRVMDTRLRQLRATA